MQVHNIAQGSPEWVKHRKDFKNASDAASAMGVSPHESRLEFIKRISTGITKEFSDFVLKKIIEKGHEFEKKARDVAEAIIGEPLYPVVGSSGEYGASFDGITIDDSIVFEHKSLNNELREAMPSGGDNGDIGEKLPIYHRIQIEQQMMVSGANKVLFMASTWAEGGSEIRYCWYHGDPELRAKIIEAWKLIDEDVANYKPVEVVAEVVAAPIESLPAVAVRVDGALSIVSNLDAFGERLKAFVAEIDMTPKTDQAFANAEEAVKVLQRAQDALEIAEANALAQVADVEILRRTVADYAKIARDTRLLLEKTVKARKEQIKVEIVQEGQKAFADHVAKLNDRLGNKYMPTIATDFGGAIKGKKLVSSLREAVDAELARAKIEANRVADAIQVNLNTLRDLASDYKFLFSDTPQIVLKDPEAVRAIVSGRISDHKQAEEKRKAEELERIQNQERERIEREERAKIEAEVRAKAEAEKAAQVDKSQKMQGLPVDESPKTQEQVRVAVRPAQRGPQRPADWDMVHVLAVHYHVHESKVVDWLKSIDFVEVNKQLEF